MKTRLLLLTSILILLSTDLFSQEAFYGTWHIRKFMHETKDSVTIIPQEKLDEIGSIWDMEFKEDGGFFQQSNMNPYARLDKMEGTWKTEPVDRLTVFISMNGQKAPMSFFYKFKSKDLMILERYDPLRTVKLILTMQKE